MNSNLNDFVSDIECVPYFWRCSVRSCAWLSYFADLGTLGGERYCLLGVARDIDLDPESRRISHQFGLANLAAVGRIELQLGASLDSMLSAGTPVEVFVREFPEPQRLIFIRKPEEPDDKDISRSQRPANWHSLDADRLHNSHIAPFIENSRRAREAFIDDLRARRDLALKASARWSIEEEMHHRQDWPAWLPIWVRHVVREWSRTWLELPGAPPPVTSSLEQKTLTEQITPLPTGNEVPPRSSASWFERMRRVATI